MTITGEEDHPFDAFLLDPAQQFIALLRNGAVVLVDRARIKHLAAYRYALEAGIAVLQRADQPVHLLVPEHRWLTGAHVGRHAERAVVHQEEVHIVVAEHTGSAFNTGHAIARVGPEQVEGFAGHARAHEGAITIVGAEVVIVPDGRVGRASQQALQLRRGPRVGVPVQKTAPAAPIRLAEVYVVAQPKHQIRLLVRDGVEDAVGIAIGTPGSVVSRFVDVCTAAQSHFEGWWIRAELPQRLRAEGEGIAALLGTSRRMEHIAVLIPRKQRTKPEFHGMGAVGVRRDRPGGGDPLWFLHRPIRNVG